MIKPMETQSQNLIDETPKIIEAQKKRIAKWLNKGKTLTGLDAWYNFGCYRLSARIYDLRREGMNIESTMIEITSDGKKKHVAKYRLVK
jgi:hypothetical protein